MNDLERTLWLSDVNLVLGDVIVMFGDEEGYDAEWEKEVMHVAEHIADASIEVLREAFMILTATPDDGPKKAHMAIVGAASYVESKSHD